MAKNMTSLESRLQECTTMVECFEIQNSLCDGLTEEEELALRAARAGLSIEDAREYQNALRTIKRIEASKKAKQLNDVNQTIINLVINWAKRRAYFRLSSSILQFCINMIIYIWKHTIFFFNIFQEFFINLILFNLRIQFGKTSNVSFYSGFCIINHSTVCNNK